MKTPYNNLSLRRRRKRVNGLVVATVLSVVLLRSAQAQSSGLLLDSAFSFGDADKSLSLDKAEFAVAIDRYEAAKHEEMAAAQTRMFNEAKGGAGDAASYFAAHASQKRGEHSVPAPRRRSNYPPLSVPSTQSTAFSKAFVNSLGMIWATEIGDKTFFIAAVMAMRHSRCVVFSGALLALVVMTVLSVAVGYALPSLLPRKYTHYASAALFLYFGVRLLRDASAAGDGPAEELAEVEDELGEKTHKRDLESGDSGGSSSGSSSTNGAASSQKHHKPKGSKRPALARVLSQAFVLTFLAEWGDRSQIATIALAAAKDPLGVTLGAVTGHAMCTGLAVLGGRMLASRISERTVGLVGGFLFLVFATYSLFFEAVPEDDLAGSDASQTVGLAMGSMARLSRGIGSSSPGLSLEGRGFGGGLDGGEAALDADLAAALSP